MAASARIAAAPFVMALLKQAQQKFASKTESEAQQS
jgi:hypothetical protein